jgi:aryl-alcohol dehydrogenase-like predicted oxidoreductase
VTPAEIALAFLLQEKAATSVIFGATSPDQVAANIRASGLAFSEEEMKRLNAVSALPFDFVSASLDGMRAPRRQYLG